MLQARDHRLARTVAIKELRRLEEDEGAEVRFLREARIAAQLEHPGIVPVHDIGFWPDGRPLYAMKLVSGRPLRAFIDECERREERLALVPKVLAVADAVAHGHQRGVVHRDLKPSNVIVGARGETVVIDSGLAKNLRGDDADATESDEIDELIEDGVTVVGEVLGTPAYMPPEQARGEEADERSDVYALGVMLYHALSGAFPYRGSSSAEVVEKVLAGPPTPLTEREPRIPQELAGDLAVQARSFYASQDERHAEELAEVGEWLAERRTRRGR